MRKPRDIIELAVIIEDLIGAIGAEHKKLDDLGDKKAQTMVDYEKALAVATLMLKSEHPVTILDKIAKGECTVELYAKMVAESGYKACIVRIEAHKAQLNAYQSLFRHLDTAQK